MLFTTVVSSLLLAGSAVAQDMAMSSGAAMSMASGASMPSSTGSAMAAGSSGDVSVQVVKVGSKNGSKTFEPNDIQAAPGSMVQFQFWPMNHSVVQSTFAQPCMPINMNMPNVTGLYSGFMPVSADSKMMPTYTVMINDTKPIWIYCSQKKHCQSGMVMAINAKQTGDKTLKAFKQLASAASNNLSPGQMPMGNSTSSAGSASSSGSAGSGSSGSAGSSGSSGNGASSTTAAAASSSTVAASSGSTVFSNMALAGFLSALVAFAL